MSVLSATAEDVVHTLVHSDRPGTLDLGLLCLLVDGT
jgi:hypothetical protein